MGKLYTPPSAFPQSILDEEAPLSGGEFGKANLRRLIEMTRDEDRANRDWATFILSSEEVDTPSVRDALLGAAQDDDRAVRAEAALGLAKLDPTLALPFVQQGLRADIVTVPMLEAAALCAHPSLIADLRIWAQPSDHTLADELAAEALEACERAGE